MIEFDIGSFIQIDGRLCLITAMNNGIAKLSNVQEVTCNQLCSVEIGNSLDKQNTLLSY